MKLTIIPLIAALSFASETQYALASEPACTRPEVNKFLEDSRGAIQFEGTYFPSPEARFLPAKIDGRDVQWMGASWYGPLSGAIFLLDCDGNRIAASNLGAVKKLRFGPILRVGQTLEITHIPGTAAGESYSNVSLVVFDGKAIKTLWDHLASDSVAMLGTEYDDRFRWQYSPDGQTIKVTGRRKVGSSGDSENGWTAGTTHALPQETYCWSGVENKFSTCR